MTTLFLISLGNILWSLVVCEIPQLIGGGCLMEDQKLVISGSFESSSSPKLTNESYWLDLTYSIQLPANETVEWLAVLHDNKIPGDLVVKTIKERRVLFYVLGDFHSPKEKTREVLNKQLSENSINYTSFYNEFINMFNQLSERSNEPSSVYAVHNRTTKEIDPLKNHSRPPKEVAEGTSSLYDLDNSNKSQLNTTNPSSDPDLKPSPEYKQRFKSIVELAQQEYYNLLKDDMKIAIKINQSIIYLENFSEPIAIGSPLSMITIQNCQTGLLEYKFTTGEIPLNRAGFSATHHQDELYITGGSDSHRPSDGNLIYRLNLVTYVWERFAPIGFRGSQSGCLYYNHPYLVHAFGMIDQNYSTTTQFIDTLTWSKVTNYDSNPSPPPPSIPNYPYITMYSISSIAGILCLLSLTSLTFLAIRWHRRSRHRIKPPPLLSSPIWSPLPRPCYLLDTTLNSSDPNLFYDSSMVAAYRPIHLHDRHHRSSSITSVNSI